ncbi:peptide chain release factor N(5)-glutamine methyltransferase [Vreelandella olivaria]|uniref:peptide chain release factor N(5)-glutamine methyltransferase n=1 Tax=Vreelandella olivaria TaxID=390919 RepID=UPI00201F492A|nr:peptide chain release factor N(5)-glutamine methyltransferase [Halomonas olivaria]
MTFDTLLQQSTQRLQEAGSPSPRIDAEALLAFVTGHDRTWLYTWGDRECPVEAYTQFEALLALRVQGQPVAYLTGEREFWGLRLATSPDTLIPRPDTETLVEAALYCAQNVTGRFLDLGTGTGAIALAFASEKPGWQVLGVDIRPEAVSTASNNALALKISNVQFVQSDWFSALTQAGQRDTFDIVVSNPPYIAADDPHLCQGDVRYEPRSALVADAGGMADLLHLVIAAREHLDMGGWLVLEHGYNQASLVREALVRAGYQNVESVQDVGGHERVTLGLL